MSNIANGIPAAAAGGGVVAALAPARPAGPPSRETESGSFSKWLAHSRADCEAPADGVAKVSSDAAEATSRGRTPRRKEASERDCAHRVGQQAHGAAPPASARGDADGVAEITDDRDKGEATGAAGAGDAAREGGTDRLCIATDTTSRPPGETATEPADVMAATPADGAQPGCTTVPGIAMAGAAIASRPAEAPRVEHGDGTARTAATGPEARRAAQPHENFIGAERRGEALGEGLLDRHVDRGGGAGDESAAAPGAARGRPHPEAPRLGTAAARDPSPLAATPPAAMTGRAVAGGESAVTAGAAAAAVEALTMNRSPARQVEFAVPGADVVALAQPSGAAVHAASQVVDAPAASAVASSLAVPFDDPGFALALGSRLAVLAREGVHRAELQLNPAEMGPISVQIALDGTRVTVDIGAAVAATRERLEASLHELAAALREAGLTLAGGGVHEHRRDRSTPAQREGDGEGGRSRTAGIGAAGEAVASTAAATHRTLRGVVDLYA